MDIQYKVINTEFKYPFTISKGTKTHQPALLVELNHRGIKGLGEAPAISYYHIPVEKMIEDIESKRAMIEAYNLNEPERFWHFLHHAFPGNNFLIAALDIAAWDIWGKMNGLPLYKFWYKKPFFRTLTDYTLGIDTTEKMVAKLRENPWPVYKVKLGTAYDIEIIETLRKHTDAPIRIDANAAWTAEEALEKIGAFEKMNIELIEQPLAKDDWQGMKRLMEMSKILLIADESCVEEADVEKCHEHFHGINIKLTKCGGITPALRMIDEARNLDMKIMLGSMNEISIGSAAIIHLSCLTDYLDSDGPLLLHETGMKGLEIHPDGYFDVPQIPGLGVSTHLFET